mmetsp:Transcript_8970/g.28642  ORF Transcript_8970/g.28642 Transcript_8970/m.28642 type:complete len:349 (+) Transcript_8970:678-1724(+)
MLGKDVTKVCNERIQLLNDGSLQVATQQHGRIVGRTGKRLLNLLKRLKGHRSAKLFVARHNERSALHLQAAKDDVTQNGKEPVALCLAVDRVCLLDLLLERCLLLVQLHLGKRLRRRHLARLAQARNQRVHEVRALPVPNVWKLLPSKHEQLTLIDTAKLHVGLEVLLVECLQDGVHEVRHVRRAHLLDNLSTGLGRVLGRHARGQLVHVEGVLLGQLVVGTLDKGKAIQRYVHEGKHFTNNNFVVGTSVFENFKGRLHVVEEAVKVGKEDGHVAASLEEVTKLDNGHKVPQVRATSGSGTPVDTKRFIAIEYLCNGRCINPAVQVSCDQLKRSLTFARGERRHFSIF